jgi:HSP20 family protein
MRFVTPYWPNKKSSLSTELFTEMDRFFEDLGARSFAPACEISESENSFHMSIDLPGMGKEDIKVEMKENVLLVSGERKQEYKTDEQRTTHYAEKRYGNFNRSFSLPNTANPEKIEAKFENGVLNLTIPKIEASKARTVEIQ